MARLNRTVAGLTHIFKTHSAMGMMDFRILGHEQNLAKKQRNKMTFVIHSISVLAKMACVSNTCGNMFGLMHGTSHETSGSLLIFLLPEQMVWFCAQMKSPKCG